MYCEFFGFSEKPFTITPNPQFIYLSEQHREAFAHLLYGIDHHAGFIAMTGEVGTGKTTVLRTLLTQLDPEKYRSALIFNPCRSGEQLMASICREFGVSPDERDSSGCIDALNLFLLDQHAAGRTVVLVVDEAHHVAPASPSTTVQGQVTGGWLLAFGEPRLEELVQEAPLEVLP